MSDSLGECIKSIRLAAGDKPGEAAAKVGVSRQGYLKWETGDTENMKLRHVVSFCDRYGIDIESLVRGTPKTILYQSRGAGKSLAGVAPLLTYKGQEPAAHKAAEPDPDETMLIEAFRKASPDLKRIMLSNAREILGLFERRSEKKK